MHKINEKDNVVRTDRSIIKQQKKLEKEKLYQKFDEIFLECGQEAYISIVPFRARKADMKKLFKEGRFLLIYEKHGEGAFKKYRNKILKEDIYYETGNKFRGEITKLRRELHTKMRRIISTGLGLVVGSNMLVAGTSEIGKIIDKNLHIKEINQYIDSINEYADSVKKSEFTDLQIIMKVMDDMWNSIDGYGNPEKDLQGYMGLDISQNGVGVCRNMAEDCARKYNAINPKYNARVIAVNVQNYDERQSANIRTFEAQEQKENNIKGDINDNFKINGQEAINKINNGINYIIGNHAVVLMEIPSDKIQVVVDPTLIAVGVYKNGEINIFNSTGKDGMKFDRRPNSDPILSGIESIYFPQQYIKSFYKSELSEEELEKKYGIQAQNKALEVIRQSPEKSWIDKIKEYYKDVDIRKEIPGKAEYAINKEKEER